MLNGDNAQLSESRKDFKDLIRLSKKGKINAKILFKNTVAIICDGSIINKGFEEIDVKHTLAGKTIGFYSASNSCERSKAFTPLLIDYYKKYQKEKQFEIVFLSQDTTEDEFKKAFEEMPWLALDFKDQNEKVIFI